MAALDANHVEDFLHLLPSQYCTALSGPTREFTDLECLEIPLLGSICETARSGRVRLQICLAISQILTRSMSWKYKVYTATLALDLHAL